MSRGVVSRLLLSALFVGSGLLHFIATDTYTAIVPDILPAPRTLVLISGVAEIAGGLGLLFAPTRRLAGWGLILLLLAVWPANFKMLFDGLRTQASWLELAVLVARIPLQVAIAWWVWRVARPGRPRPLASEL